MVGASGNEMRPSYFAMKYLLAKGFVIHPINPGMAGKEILGQTVYASLKDVPAPVDMVDIFRAPDAAPGIVREALAEKDRLGLKTIWMQLGVVSEEAAELARAAPASPSSWTAAPRSSTAASRARSAGWASTARHHRQPQAAAVRQGRDAQAPLKCCTPLLCNKSVQREMTHADDHRVRGACRDVECHGAGGRGQGLSQRRRGRRGGGPRRRIITRVLGAVVGCAVGHHLAVEKAREQKAQAAQHAEAAPGARSH